MKCVCVCVCVCVRVRACVRATLGTNTFQLPSNTVEGAYSAYESECVCVVCVLCGGVYEIIIIISQLHWVSLRAAH